MALKRSSCIFLSVTVFTTALLCLLLALPVSAFPLLPQILLGNEELPAPMAPPIEHPLVGEPAVSETATSANPSPSVGTFPSETDDEATARSVVDSEIVMEGDGVKLTPE